MDINKLVTEDYALQIVDKEGFPIYNIINRKTGVVEYEDHLLSRVIGILPEMQDRLTQAWLAFESVVQTVKGPPKLSIVGDKDDDKGSIH